MVRSRVLESWEFGGDWGYWLSASVPGHVHLDLLQHDQIEDPFVRQNEALCQWVDEDDWSYRCYFDWRPDESAPHRVLRFEGLDTVCVVAVNGRHLASLDNMFLPLELPVSEVLRPGQNEILVRFWSAARMGRERRAEYLAEHGLPDDVPNFDERAFVRKAQCMFGWDWGPRLVSCGIWKPVTLIEYEGRILDVHTQQSWNDDGTVDVTVRTEFEGENVIPRHIFGDLQFLDGTVRLGVTEDAPVAAWERFKPWTPNGIRQGGEERYNTLVTVLARRGDPQLEALIAGEQPGRPSADSPEKYVDHRWGTLDLSNVRLLQEPDEYGTSFAFSVNGKRIFALGANWIPDDSFPSRVDRKRLRERLTSARDMGVNMLRVWGGGVYESDDFYDLCDELGILVWQDFMFACSYYPDTPEWQAKIRQEAEHQVQRLRRHPCIAVWCGNNECHQVWQDGWGGKDRQPSRFHGEVLYHETLREVVERLDPARAYIPGSPYGGEYCNSGDEGDQHYWDVWHGRGDWTHYKDSSARFSSEFGFASSPSAATWQRAAVPMTVAKEHPDARWHNKTGKPFEVFESLVGLHYPKAESLEEWSYYSQLNQRDAMREAIEHYRFSPRCEGALIWQLNDCWPVESWSLLEFGGHKKAAAHELRRLYAPLLLRIRLEEGRAILEAVSHNTDQRYQAPAMLHAFGKGSYKAVFTDESIVAPGHARELVSFDHPIPGAYLWIGQFLDATACLCTAKPTGSDRNPPAKIATKGRVLTVTAEAPLVDVFLEDAGDPENSFEPNFFTLLPGGSMKVTAARKVRELKVRSLKFD